MSIFQIFQTLIFQWRIYIFLVHLGTFFKGLCLSKMMMWVLLTLVAHMRGSYAVPSGAKSCPRCMKIKLQIARKNHCTHLLLHAFIHVHGPRHLQGIFYRLTVLLNEGINDSFMYCTRPILSCGLYIYYPMRWHRSH